MTLMQWKIETPSDRGQLVFISGFITEEANFQPLAALEAPAVLRLDLAGVEQINSCGVREWIHFVRLVSRSHPAFELVRCSPAIVRQLNTISNFRGGATVRSVMLPYFCAECEREELRLLEMPTSGPPPSIEESVICSNCEGSMEFDDLPTSYMAFAA